VDSAIEALDFETEPPSKLSFGAARRVDAQSASFVGCLPRPDLTYPKDIARGAAIEVNAI